jgi:TatD DNase family protein
MSLPVNIHTHRLFAGNVIQILSCDNQSFESNAVFAFGEQSFRSLAFHPMKWQNGDTIPIEETITRLQLADVIALGESGLDKSSDLAIEQQLALFRVQEQLSIQTGLPIVIHCVGRWNELELLYKDKQPGSPAWVIHGFRKTKLADKFLGLGAYLSFGKALLYDDHLQQAIPSIPLDRIFLETDDAEVDILRLYEQLAALKSLSLQAVTDQLFSNYRTVFHHGKLA